MRRGPVCATDTTILYYSMQYTLSIIMYCILLLLLLFWRFVHHTYTQAAAVLKILFTWTVDLRYYFISLLFFLLYKRICNIITGRLLYRRYRRRHASDIMVDSSCSRGVNEKYGSIIILCAIYSLYYGFIIHLFIRHSYSNRVKHF